MNNLFQLGDPKFQKKLYIYYQWMIVIGISIFAFAFLLAKFYITFFLQIVVAISFIPLFIRKKILPSWLLALLRLSLMSLSFLIL